jgi:uncharacterized membrane-anchored protein YhcB (DUF1043 family)
MTHADSIWAKAIEAQNDSLLHSVDALQAKLEALQSKTDLLTDVVETANDGVSNQLSAANNLLALVAVIMAVVGIWLGIYIAKKKRQIDIMASTIEAKKKTVEQLAEIVDKKKEKVDEIAKSTEELDKKIHGDLTGLYKDLRKEETNALLERLVLEPQDVENLGTVLCARDIDETGYVKLKTAYFTMKKMLEDGSQKNVVRDYSEYYIVLFYQHFFYKALIDDEISPEFEKYYGSIFSRAFNRDMIKSTIDLCKALSEETSTFNKELVLVTYLKALNSSQYSEFAELKNIFEQNISPQILLQNAISRCTAEQVYLKLFNITPPASEDAVTQ